MQRAWAMVRLARPLILTGGLMAYALGLAMAYHDVGALDWGVAWLGLAILCLACFMAQYADEYADQDTDAITRRTSVSGGSGVLPAGLVPAAWALRAAYVCGAAAAGVCVWGVASGGLPPVALATTAIGLVGGWVYSMPPVALERRGLGEIDNALLGGLLMPTTAYLLQAGRLPARIVTALVPVTIAVLINLLGVHWPDRLADAAVGRVSLPVLMGDRTRTLHHALTGAMYALFAWQAVGLLPGAVAWISLGTLPLGLWATATFGRRASPWPSVLLMSLVLVGQAAGYVLARG